MSGAKNVEILKILLIHYPKLTILCSDQLKREIDLKLFINKIAPDKNNPYRKILESVFFENVYLQSGKLCWAEGLSQMNCGGETTQMPIEFDSHELLN